MLQRLPLAKVCLHRGFRSVSTTTYTLTRTQPLGSPIDTSRAPAALDSVDPNHFRIHVNALSLEEQYELLKCALKKLDDSRGVSRAIKKRRKALPAVDVDRPASSLSSDITALFLPDDCYDFEEVSQGN